jgi:hypothetical protein
VIFCGVERGRYVELTNISPSVSRLSRQCGILNISQPYRPLRLVTGIVILLYIVGRSPWTRNEPVSRPLPTHRTTQTQITHAHIPRVGFEPTILTFEREKIAYPLWLAPLSRQQIKRIVSLFGLFKDNVSISTYQHQKSVRKYFAYVFVWQHCW